MQVNTNHKILSVLIMIIPSPHFAIDCCIANNRGLHYELLVAIWL